MANSKVLSECKDPRIEGPAQFAGREGAPVTTDNLTSARNALLSERGFLGRPLPALVKRSWDRCLQSGLRADDDRIFQSAPRRADVEQIADRYQSLIRCALPEMESLLATVKNPEWCVLCTDASGMVIKSVAHSVLPSALQLITTPGKGLSEDEIGTTAPGCAIIERKAVRVAYRQHFLHAIKNFVCAAAPIFDAAGNLTGVIDLSGVDVVEPSDMLERVALAAKAIENRLVCQTDGTVTVRFHVRSDMLRTPHSGLLRFSDEGVLVGANTTARRLLSMLKDDKQRVTFDALFERGVGELSSLSKSRTEATFLTSVGGNPFCAVIDIERQHRKSLLNRNSARKTELQVSASSSPVLIDPGLATTIERARRVYAQDVPVFVTGETGTGKEVFARMLHDTGSRAAGPFIAINCSAIPESLIESELFGYEEGSFTGARRGGAPGKIEGAHKGTLFLDEIGDMPLDMQTRLLRVLQERAVTRVGSNRSLPIDFGLVSATHRDISLLLERNAFRQDLFFRIRGLRVTLPPLRKRQDIEQLIDVFLSVQDRACRRFYLSPEARDLLLGYEWPGNIRELQQTILVASALARDDGMIGLEHLPEYFSDKTGSIVLVDSRGCATSLANQGERLIRQALEHNAHNISATARSLGIARTTLYRRLRKGASNAQ